MGKFKIAIDFGETIYFETNKIKDFYTRTMATNDPTKPVFDVFANQGLLVIKDTDLALYNKAINGDFDNTYQFKVYIYKGDNLIASHIINQRPIYDYANKTLTLNLGNEIDSYDNILYKGLDYALKEENKLNIAYDIFDYKTNEYIFLFEDGGENERHFCKVAYLPEMSRKEALKKLCEMLGCSCILSEKLVNNRIKQIRFVDMLGTNNENRPIYKLLPKHTKSSFKPNIILDNRFSNAIVNATSLYTEYYNETTILEKTINNPKLDNFYYQYKLGLSFGKTWEIPQYEPIEGSEIISVGIYNFNGFYYSISEKLNKTIKNNLATILNIKEPNALELKEEDLLQDYENYNPSVFVVLKKITYNPVTISSSFNGRTRKLINWNYEDTPYDYFKTNGIEKEEFNYFNGRTVLNKYSSVTLSIEDPFYGGEQEETFVFETPRVIGAPSIDKNNNGYGLYATVLVGKSYLEMSFSGIIGEKEEEIVETEAKLIEYIPTSIQYIFNGSTQEIKFDKNLQINSTSDNTNKIEMQSGNELIQTNLDGTIEGSSAELLQKDLYNFYKDGIRTGELEVIFDNYVAEDGVTQKDIDTPFKIGDLVIPCKDNQGTPIIGKNEKSYKEKTVFSLGNNKIQKATIKFDKKITNIINVYGYSTNTENLNTVLIKNYIISGNAVIVNYSTISAGEITIRVDVDLINFSVYKVVDVEIDYNGGAGSQRLKLMEQPNLTLEDTATASEASEPMATMLLSEETPLETEIDESQSVLSNEEETSQEMSNNGFDDLINL